VGGRVRTQAGGPGPAPDALPTGAELLEDYLGPLAALPALASRIRLHTTVVAVARRGPGQGPSPGRRPPPLPDPGPRPGWATGGPAGAGGDRRLRHLDPAQPPGRLRAARTRRGRRRRPD